MTRAGEGPEKSERTPKNNRLPSLSRSRSESRSLSRNRLASQQTPLSQSVQVERLIDEDSDFEIEYYTPTTVPMKIKTSTPLPPLRSALKKRCLWKESNFIATSTPTISPKSKTRVMDINHNTKLVLPSQSRTQTQEQEVRLQPSESDNDLLINADTEYKASELALKKVTLHP